jgi:hypothetical protein
VGWKDILTFYNLSSQPLTVRIVGISNGGAARITPDSIEVPPGAVISADTVLADAWRPQNGSNLWMMHLDIPSGIVIESRDEILVGDTCTGALPPVSVTRSAGKASLPIFRAAVPANSPQIYLGTDVGSKDARINVGIYNQGDVAASAHVEVRRECDNSVVESRDVFVPSDTLMQFTGFNTGPNACSPTGATASWLRYTIITVDQPSMTYVIALSEKRDDLGIPQIGIAVPANVSY